MNRFTYRGTNTPPELRTPHSHPTEANGTRSRMDTRALTARSGRLRVSLWSLEAELEICSVRSERIPTCTRGIFPDQSAYGSIADELQCSDPVRAPRRPFTTRLSHGRDTGTAARVVLGEDARGLGQRASRSCPEACAASGRRERPHSGFWKPVAAPGG